jgi:8-oxo-dGTP pyrophosphatase MutT (NUDIX family)
MKGWRQKRWAVIAASRIVPSIRRMTGFGSQQNACVQYAALPFRRRPDGAIEIMVVTSRTTRRWIIPKGWPMKGKSPAGTARREALEEAGLVGRISERCVGSFRAMKRLRDGRRVACEVHVFPLTVARQRSAWREKHQRQTRWFSTEAAAAAVTEPELSRLIARFRGERGMSKTDQGA